MLGVAYVEGGRKKCILVTDVSMLMDVTQSETVVS